MLNFISNFRQLCTTHFFIFKTACKKSKLIITTISLFLLLIIILQIHLIFYCKNVIPFHSVIIFLILTILSFGVSIYTLFQTLNLEKVNKILEDEKLHNKALKVMHDGIRVFKHDFSNIMQALEGYIINDDIIRFKKVF